MADPRFQDGVSIPHRAGAVGGRPVPDRKVGRFPQDLLHPVGGLLDQAEDRPAVDDGVARGRETSDDPRQLGEGPIRASEPRRHRLPDVAEGIAFASVGQDHRSRGQSQHRLQIIEVVAEGGDLPRHLPARPVQVLGDEVQLELAQAVRLAAEQLLDQLMEVLELRDVLVVNLDGVEPGQEAGIRRGRVRERDAGVRPDRDELLAEPGEVADALPPGLIGEGCRVEPLGERAPAGSARTRASS